MLLTRTAAQGRLSELLQSEPKLNDVDRYMRTFGFRRTAERAVIRLNQLQRKRLQAYCDGVNAYVENTYGKLMEMYLVGMDYTPWTVADALSLVAVRLVFRFVLSCVDERRCIWH